MANITAVKKLLNNEVIRFVFSAGLGFLVDVFVFFLLNKHLFVANQYQIFSFAISNYYLSFSISFFLGVLVNFLITRYFVFTASTSSPSKQFTRFASVATLGYFANIGLLGIFIRKFQFDPTVARITAAFSLFFASYFVHKFFSFSLALRHHASRNPNPKSN